MASPWTAISQRNSWPLRALSGHFFLHSFEVHKTNAREMVALKSFLVGVPDGMAGSLKVFLEGSGVLNR